MMGQNHISNLEAVSKSRIALVDKAQADEKAQHTRSV
jgi:hypothetical protein